MIKNIVFDMGNVLVDYTADGVCRHFIEDPETRKKVSTSVFVSPEWILLDKKPPSPHIHAWDEGLCSALPPKLL